MKTYNTMPGQHIQRAAEEMVKLANDTGEPVTATFNEIPLDAAPGSDPEEVPGRVPVEMAVKVRLDFLHAGLGAGPMQNGGAHGRWIVGAGIDLRAVAGGQEHDLLQPDPGF